jgi:tryptophan synthase beta subunit
MEYENAKKTAAQLTPDTIVAICLSGRSDKDMDTVVRALELG